MKQNFVYVLIENIILLSTSLIISISWSIIFFLCESYFNVLAYYSMGYLSISQIFITQLLCTRHCSSHWGNNSERNSKCLLL